MLNTLRHSEGSARIEISLEVGRFTVSNPGSEPLDKDKLFKRFTSASTKNPGSGLGLAIVRQIANRYGWKVEYRFQAGRQQFTVLFT
ncbi:sensor histidine kinase [Hufsiella ginkgonis]|uniref:Histidine kinase/HSP90-like ATPase domain-containing protein n=1 Tax=Hufsiella ginkgonis TaxID=2695274 RepID=A0A7K1XSP6_9SPHI|nr:ATP-binding protein [Hufsiella ginkgonis]MXV14033.1 hypothetical protein [Hufsiella ginkgonis]